VTHVDHRTFWNGEAGARKLTSEFMKGERGYPLSAKSKSPLKLCDALLTPILSLTAKRPDTTRTLHFPLAAEAEWPMPMHDRELLVCSTTASLGSSGAGVLG
jgi:hypothetical protein